jgi:hypothetical protein
MTETLKRIPYETGLKMAGLTPHRSPISTGAAVRHVIASVRDAEAANGPDDTLTAEQALVHLDDFDTDECDMEAVAAAVEAWLAERR